MATGVSRGGYTLGDRDLLALQQHLGDPQRSFITLKEGRIVCVTCDDDDDYDTDTDPLLKQIIIDCQTKTEVVYTQVICDPEFQEEIDALVKKIFTPHEDLGLSSQEVDLKNFTLETQGWVDVTRNVPFIDTKQPVMTRVKEYIVRKFF